MKSYEYLNIEISNLASADIITTSSDVTTGGIAFPWQGDEDINAVKFNLLTSAHTQSFNLDLGK